MAWKVRVWVKGTTRDVEHEGVYDFDPESSAYSALEDALDKIIGEPLSEIQVRLLSDPRNDGKER